MSDGGRYPIISIIAFSGKASLNVTVESAHVIYWRDLAPTIKQYRTEVIDDEQVQRIADTLQQANVTTAGRNREHVKRVRQTAVNYEHALASSLCPRCGGRLVERKGAYGRFYGCSNYPKCKFTHRC
ncbi:topoisomerase DNA-binding C4 zinc finger domain-containing protein [Alistipes putredinis]|uniref:topoisomerase DNA-binding C4 zinc finger domain-containing protein n=1 Tax=Alistipes putredinis TaxID=28117 RepID=UPI003AB459BF